MTTWKFGRENAKHIPVDKFYASGEPNITITVWRDREEPDDTFGRSFRTVYAYKVREWTPGQINTHGERYTMPTDWIVLAGNDLRSPTYPLGTQPTDSPEEVARTLAAFLGTPSVDDPDYSPDQMAWLEVNRERLEAFATATFADGMTIG